MLIFLAGLLSNKFYCVALGTVLATEVTEILLTSEPVWNWLHCIWDWNVGIFGVKLKLL